MTNEEITSKLVEHNLLNPNTHTKIVHGIEGEDALLAEWREQFSSIDMGIERLTFGDTRCWPIFTND
jgi:hypothetical protein